MNAALRWTLYGGIGGLGGLLTYVLSLKWFPYVTIRDLLGPIPKDPEVMGEYVMKLLFREPLTTLGTTYGNVAYFLLGAFICGGLVTALRWERHGALCGLGWGFLAFFLGGSVSRGLDAFHDIVIMKMGFTGNLVPDIFWSLLVGLGIALTIGFFQGPTAPRMKRALIAGVVAAVVAYGVRQAAGPLGDLSSPDLFGSTPDRRTLETQNLWESSRWSFLIQYIAMGISLGLSFAFVESTMRKGTLRLELGRNEGESWELPAGPVLLGSAEGCNIRLPARLGVAPRHASIVPHTEHGLALAPEPGQSIAVNGRPTGGEWLCHGDRIGLGKATLIYEEANALRGSAAAPRHPSHWLEIPDGRRIELPQGVSVIGNQAGHAVPLASAGVAPRHAEIRVSNGRAILGDLGTPAGTRVSGAPVTTRELRDGDIIELGSGRLVYRSVTAQGLGTGR